MTITYTANIKNYLFYIIGGIALNLTFAAIIVGIYAFSFFLAFNTIYTFYQLRTYRPRIISFNFENKIFFFLNDFLLDR